MHLDIKNVILGQKLSIWEGGFPGLVRSDPRMECVEKRARAWNKVKASAAYFNLAGLYSSVILTFEGGTFLKNEVARVQLATDSDSASKLLKPTASLYIISFISSSELL